MFSLLLSFSIELTYLHIGTFQFSADFYRIMVNDKERLGVVRVTVSYFSRQDAEQGRKEMGRVLSTAMHIVFSWWPLSC